MIQEPWRGRAPGRVNLIGEHVDYLGGIVLAAAIDRYTVVVGRSAADWLIASDVEGGLPFARAIGAELGASPQALVVASNVPPGAGVSSSAALLMAIATGLSSDLPGKEAALACQRAEERATGVGVGVMDHFASALGRSGHALLLNCSTLEYKAVPFPSEVAIAVIDSGQRRSLGRTPYNERRREAEAGHPRRRRHVETEIERVHSFVDALKGNDFFRMGHLLNESHRSLRDHLEVSTAAIDSLVDCVQSLPGCYGARIMGAGFGGSVLALVDNQQTDSFRAALDRPALFCSTADGSCAAA